MAENINILCYNVNELHKYQKQKALVQRLLYPKTSNPPDIFCFKETHSHHSCQIK